MHTTRALVLGLAFALSCAAAIKSAQAHAISHRTLDIIHPWTPASAHAQATEAAISLKIRNRGTRADRLIAVHCARATAMLSEAGPAPTQAAPVEVKPGSEAVLEPRGVHIRLVGLDKPLHAYDSVPLTLVFERAGRVQVEVLVEEAAEPHANH